MLLAFKKNKWIQSFLIVILLFLLINLFFLPLFNSGDDVFLMYTLGGGYGEAPSHLLHYNHIWHPLLGWIVKTLFISFPTINWYTLFLMILQVFGCATILYVFLRRFQWIIAFGLFMILFVFFEARILLSLNFTATSWILATGGYVLLLQESIVDKKNFNILISCILVFVAGLLRLHILFCVTILFLPAFFFYARRRFQIWVPVILFICASLFLLNLEHKSFYRKNIPGWQTEEKIRQTLFSGYNRPLHHDKQVNQVFGDSVKRAFYFNYFFYDTNFISFEKTKQIIKSLIRYRDFSVKEDKQVLYWSFMELRVYFLLFIIIFFLLWTQNLLKKIVQRWIPTSVLIFAIYGYLFLFFKMTEPIHLGVLTLLWIFLCFAIPGEKIQTILQRKSFRYSALLLILPFSWMTVRIIKKDSINQKKHQRFECVTAELRNNQDKLFITTDDALPLDYFYIWDSPAQYQLPNLIYKDRVINNCYKPTLQRFNVTDIMRAIYQKENVFLLGRDFPELKNYYKIQERTDVIISSRLSNYKCLEVRKVSH